MCRTKQPIHIFEQADHMSSLDAVCARDERSSQRPLFSLLQGGFDHPVIRKDAYASLYRPPSALFHHRNPNHKRLARSPLSRPTRTHSGIASLGLSSPSRTVISSSPSKSKAA